MGIIFANEKTIDRIRSMEALKGHLLFQMPINNEVDARVADHTDLSMFISDAVYIAPCIYRAFRDKLFDDYASSQHLLYKNLSEKILLGTLTLKKEYPFNIGYNAVLLKNHFFHKLEYSEPKILENLNCDRIDVGQGYTRCATMVLTENAVITEDVGLARVYEACGYDVLTIDKGYITLPGYNYGFIGGTGGVIENNLVLNGALSHHPNGDAIMTFVHKLGLSIVELHNGPLIDCGSILYLNTQNEGG